MQDNQTEMSFFKSEAVEAQVQRKAPLAYRQRPLSLEHFCGQDKALRALSRFQAMDTHQHLIFWGPPGCGKTTLAHLLAQQWNMELYPFNAVMEGVSELRKLIQSIKDVYQFHQKSSVLFIDEIHRFNKAQQDALLPHLEKGDFILLGATTENPRTSLNKAILSRVQCIALEELSDSDIESILERANQELKTPVSSDYVRLIASYSHGDARFALNKLEALVAEDELNRDMVINLLKQDSNQYDRAGDRHYDVISAFIKSVRGSDPDAALLWLAVMLEGGEDPFFIARRLVILASEDIGNANPLALQVATAALASIHQVGMPEARIPLAQATTYLASSPKSNASYLAIDEAIAYVRENPTLEVPTHLRNHHPDKKNYQYPHSYAGHHIEQQYLPDGHTEKQFYKPTEQGTEKVLAAYLKSLKRYGKR
jgi:putative ATPase